MSDVADPSKMGEPVLPGSPESVPSTAARAEHRPLEVRPGARPVAPAARLRILMLCSFAPGTEAGMMEHALALKDGSRHDVYLVDPVGGSRPGWLDLGRFDVLVIHRSIDVLSPESLGPAWREAIAEASALKVLFRDDDGGTVEASRLDAFHRTVRVLRLNVLYSNFRGEALERVHPAAAIPGVERVLALPEYLAPALEETAAAESVERRFDVGFRLLRPRNAAVRAANETIAVEFLKAARRAGLRADISPREAHRLAGDERAAWLKHCRFVLGTEIGETLIRVPGPAGDERPHVLPRPGGPTLAEVRARFLDESEDAVLATRPSPWLLRAVAAGTGLVLFEGDYAGVLEPGRHYLPLRRDFANVADVAARIRDEAERARMCRDAYDDLIRSRRYTYREFVSRFDDLMAERAVTRRGGRVSAERLGGIEISRVLDFHPLLLDAWVGVLLGKLARRVAQRLAGAALRVLAPIASPVLRVLAAPFRVVGGAFVRLVVGGVRGVASLVSTLRTELADGGLEIRRRFRRLHPVLRLETLRTYLALLAMRRKP